MKTERFKHSADLPVDSLTQNHSQMGWIDRMNALDPRAFSIERDSALQLWRQSRIPLSIQKYVVFLVDLVPRMSELLGEFAVVCEKNESLGLRVEPADVEKPREFRREQIENCLPCVPVLPCGDKSGWLMQHDCERRIDMDQFAVDFNVIARRRLDAEVRADPPVNGDTPCRDQFIAVPTRTDARGCEEAVEAHVLESDQSSVISEQSALTDHRSLSADHCALHIRLGFGKADNFLVLLPLTALLQKFDTLKALQNIALGSYGAGAF